MSYSLNFLKGGYIRDYMGLYGELLEGLLRDTRSLGGGPYKGKKR